MTRCRIRGCPVDISDGRTICRYHARLPEMATKPALELPGNQLSHLRSHLSKTLAERLDDVLLPLPRAELAQRWFVTEDGASEMQRRMAERIWPCDDGPGFGTVRLALLRIVVGLDPCPCGMMKTDGKLPSVARDSGRGVTAAPARPRASL